MEHKIVGISSSNLFDLDELFMVEVNDLEDFLQPHGTEIPLFDPDHENGCFELMDQSREVWWNDGSEQVGDAVGDVSSNANYEDQVINWVQFNEGVDRDDGEKEEEEEEGNANEEEEEEEEEEVTVVDN